MYLDNHINDFILNIEKLIHSWLYTAIRHFAVVASSMTVTLESCKVLARARPEWVRNYNSLNICLKRFFILCSGDVLLSLCTQWPNGARRPNSSL